MRAYTEAANRHDLEAFLALYAPGIRKFRFPGELTSEGSSTIGPCTPAQFSAAPDLKIEILELFAVGDKVVVHDRVTGRPGWKNGGRDYRLSGPGRADYEHCLRRAKGSRRSTRNSLGRIMKIRIARAEVCPAKSGKGGWP